MCVREQLYFADDPVVLLALYFLRASGGSGREHERAAAVQEPGPIGPANAFCAVRVLELADDLIHDRAAGPADEGKPARDAR